MCDVHAFVIGPWMPYQRYPFALFIGDERVL